MKLGAFSISLSVKNLNTSKEFYEKLGFTVFAGDPAKNYYIMQNGETNIGLFQGMFENNILTFNPGWSQKAEKLEEYEDIRQIQQQLKAKDVAVLSEADESTTGPANMILVDPDGNQILFDQHV